MCAESQRMHTLANFDNCPNDYEAQHKVEGADGELGDSIAVKIDIDIDETRSMNEAACVE